MYNVITSFRQQEQMMVIHKEKKQALIVDIAVPADTKIAEKDLEKVD